MKPLVYIAGPYTRPDPVGNVRRAISVAEYVEQALGVDVAIPHLSLLWDLISPALYERWLERDLGVLARCDALVRFPGESSGADAEIVFAGANAIPVFYMTASLALPTGAYAWAERSKAAR